MSDDEVADDVIADDMMTLDQFQAKVRRDTLIRKSSHVGALI